MVRVCGFTAALKFDDQATFCTFHNNEDLVRLNNCIDDDDENGAIVAKVRSQGQLHIGHCRKSKPGRTAALRLEYQPYIML